MNKFRKMRNYMKGESIDYILFIYVCTSFVILSIISVPINILLGYGWNSFFLVIGSIVINCVCIHMVFRDRRKIVFAKFGFLLNLYILFIFMWFLSDGINGPTLIYFVLLLLLSIVLADSKRLLFIFISINFIVVFWLLGLNNYMSNMIIEYESQENRLTDISVSYLVLVCIVSISCYFLLTEYKNVHMELINEKQKLERMSFTDPLTQLWNRRFINEQLER